MRWLIILLLLLAACGDDHSDKIKRPVEQESAWQIGPVIDGANYSEGLGLLPEPSLEGPVVSIGPDQEPHYVTFKQGSLAGKVQLRMRYRMDAPEGVRYYSDACPNGPATLTLYFQRHDPIWNGDGGRWWATFASVTLPAGPTEGEIIAPFSGRWTGVETYNSEAHRPLFDAALADADRVGFTIGDCTGYGHGSRASIPVRLTILSYEVV